MAGGASVRSPARGESWYADLAPTVGREQSGERPVLVVSADWFNRRGAGLAVVVPLTTRDRALASHVRIDPPEGGVKQTSFAMCEAVRSISRERFTTRWKSVGATTSRAVDDRLRALLGL